MFLLGMLVWCTAQAYPVTYNNCGVENTLQKAPERIIGMNQGVVEFLLGLGLGSKIIGTRPLDDAIWPRYAQDFEHVKIHLNPDWWNYPNESTVMAEQADFIIGSWASSFREAYIDDEGNSKGLFSESTVGPCTGPGSQQHAKATDGPASADNYRTCRPQLNTAGIGTWLLSDACEDKTIRADVTALGEEFVYEEMRRIGNLFQVDVEPKIQEMKNDFDKAALLVSVAMDKPLTAIWVDCVSCCEVDEGQEPQVYVGAGSGTPNLIMNEAGLVNSFKDKPGLWVCVNESDIAAANPDVMILVDWKRDPALETKATWLYSDSKFCGMSAVRAGRFVTLPFSASGPSPRNGPTALDLAIASLHVQKGAAIATQESGVSTFNPTKLKEHTQNMVCSLKSEEVAYTDAAANVRCDSKTGSCKPVDDYVQETMTTASTAFTVGISWLCLVATAVLMQ